MATAYVVQATEILLPAVSDAWWAAAISSMLFGSMFVGIAALTLTYAREVTGARRADLAIGLLTAVYGAGQVLGPLVAAHLAKMRATLDLPSLLPRPWLLWAAC